MLLLGIIALVGGVIASFLPVPGPALSLSGIFLCWWAMDFQQPHPVLLGVLVGVGLIALLVDLLGPLLAGRLGGASTRTAFVSGLLGLLGLIGAGPIGFIVTILVATLVIEYYRNRNLADSTRAAATALLGTVASPLIQCLLTGSILLSMLMVFVV